MPLRRRETLALSGVLLAGLAGCMGSDDPQTIGTATDTTRDTATPDDTLTETTPGDETTTGGPPVSRTSTRRRSRKSTPRPTPKLPRTC